MSTELSRRRDRATDSAPAWVAIAATLFAVTSSSRAQTPDPLASCRQPPAVAWQSAAPASDRAVLDRWCNSVGPPLIAAGAEPPARLATVVLATWNVHAGNGDVDAFLQSLPGIAGVKAPYGVVLMLQEAVRASAEVPERYPDRMRPPSAIRAPRGRQDVGALATMLRMHVAYVPSMRNGRMFMSDAREDRGNAILSTFPLEDVLAIELPFGRQRHIAVAARVRVAGLPTLRVLSVHLDPSGHRTKEAHALARQLPRLAAPDERLVMGGDLNTWFGAREEALKTLSAAVPEEDCGRAKTNSWPWNTQAPFGWWRGRMDYLFTTLQADVMRTCETIPQQFASDHRPVVLIVPVPNG